MLNENTIELKFRAFIHIQRIIEVDYVTLKLLYAMQIYKFNLKQ